MPRPDYDRNSKITMNINMTDHNRAIKKGSAAVAEASKFAYTQNAKNARPSVRISVERHFSLSANRFWGSRGPGARHLHATLGPHLGPVWAPLGPMGLQIKNYFKKCLLQFLPESVAKPKGNLVFATFGKVHNARNDKTI